MSVAAISLPAPAKLNLTLDVGALRPDGFHEVDSVVVVAHGPADRVTVQVTRGRVARAITLTCTDPALPVDDGNIARRAARLVCEQFAPDISLQVQIHLEKRLPHQAGLGGGSSDAAAVLRGLYILLPEHLPDGDALLPVAATLGSDVALFLSPGPVRMQGRGESVAPLKNRLPRLHGVIVQPEIGVPTGPAYARLDSVIGRIPGAATERLMSALNQGAIHRSADLAPLLANDFTAPIRESWPAVGAALDAVQATGALAAHLCGSGSAVFGLARDPEHAVQLALALSPQFPYTRIFTT